MAWATLQQRIDAAVSALADILRERPLRVACSGGRDSTVCLILAMRAAEALLDADQAPMPLIISSSETGIENPEVVSLLRSLHASAVAHGQAIGVEVMSCIVRPNLLEHWWPKMLAGRKLPSYPGSSNDCSIDMKLRPQERLAREVDALLDERGLPSPVTVIGTRRDESAPRRARMAERGEQADEVVDGLIAPIADWTVDDVMTVCVDRNIDKFQHDYRALVNFYGDSVSGECIVTPGHRVGAAQGGCSSRSGCHQCQKVADDRSMAALVSTAKYDHLTPLLNLNRYLKRIRWDLTRRSWLGREIDPATNCVRLGPNCLSFDECDRLLRMVLSMDRDEALRAEGLRQAIVAGEAEDTPLNRRLATPQFRNIDESAIVAIDFMRAVDCFGPPHSALKAWHDVYSRGQQYAIPDLTPVARPDTLPAPTYLPLDPSSISGLFDPTLNLATEESYARPQGNRGGMTPYHPDCDSTGFDVVLADAAEFLAWELEERVAHHDTGHHPITAAHYYLRIGVVHLPKGYAATLDRHMTRSQALHDAGLMPAAVCPTKKPMTEDQHNDLVWSLGLEAGVIGPESTRPNTIGGWRRLSTQIVATPKGSESADPGADYWAERAIGLECAVASGVSRFDGLDLNVALREAQRALGRLPDETAGSALSSAWACAESFLDDGSLGDGPTGLFPWLVIGESAFESTRPSFGYQRDLFGIAA